ncbi:MAG: exodeoxyribonuclease I, partial [Gammaproteobacteria bacterium]|nr:exodeoxyribonuclease I [Gammaproteobacteria bacterium]
DLRQDPSALLSASVETIRRRVFTALEDLAEGEDRFPLKAVHANRCPILVPSSILRTVDPQRLAGFELDGDVLRKHLAILRDGAADLGARIREAFDQPPSAETDPDVMLYSGGFLSSQDKALLSRYVAAEPHELAGLPQNFQDGRLEEMVFRYRARNYPETLMDDEQERWEALRRSRLVHGQGGARTFERLYADLQRLARSADHQNARDQGILEDLQLYAESLIPYD